MSICDLIKIFTVCDFLPSRVRMMTNGVSDELAANNLEYVVIVVFIDFKNIAIHMNIVFISSARVLVNLDKELLANQTIVFELKVIEFECLKVDHWQGLSCHQISCSRYECNVFHLITD